MKYTEKCRLPQWDETDRVLRTDFNDAFAGLERIGADHGQLRWMAGNLIRDAYRREVQGRILHGRCGLTDGMWINALSSREEAGGDGHGWNGRYGVCHGTGGLPDLEDIKASAEEECYISTVSSYVYQSRRAAVTFTSRGYGKIDQLGIFAWPNEHYSNKPFDFTVTMTRVDDGSPVAEAGPFTTVLKPYNYLVTYYQVDFPLEPHVEYRMEFTAPEGQDFNGVAGFSLATKHADSSKPMTLAARTAEGTISKTVTPPEHAEEASGIVRWRGSGQVAMSVNDVEMREVRVRETVNAEGVPCRETEFSLEKIPEGELTVALEMVKGEENLDVFDYGLIWR